MVDPNESDREEGNHQSIERQQTVDNHATVSEFSQGGSDNVSNLLCLPCCKHNRKEKRECQKVNMIQCSICFLKFHEECVDAKKDDFACWPCPSCRAIPSNISKIFDILVPLQKVVQESKTSSDTVARSLNQLETQCRFLREENTALQSKVDDLTRKLQDIQSKESKTSLVVGDSLLRDINPGCLVDTEVKVIPGGKVNDVLKHLQDDVSESLGRIVLAAGTNDCSSQDFECETTSKVFKDVINLAKQKVPESKDVCIMSVPPRTDSDVHQQKVDLFNACLCTVAQDTGTTFINNDPSFRLASGVINDGYLMSDGFHLNQYGTNRLVKNAKLRIHSRVKDGNVCKKK